jgi:ubiquinone/menaquinone biosynthesis C-methylase UbiE
MLEVARRRAADGQVGNVTFTQADAQLHPFTPASVDVAISRLGSMFFADPLAAFTNVRRALRPGGRLVLLVWQSFDDNEFLHRVLDALTPGRETPLPPAQGPSPLSLADPQRVHALLEQAVSPTSNSWALSAC